jgi:hypothetical protein
MKTTNNAMTRLAAKGLATVALLGALVMPATGFAQESGWLPKLPSPFHVNAVGNAVFQTRMPRFANENQPSIGFGAGAGVEFETPIITIRPTLSLLYSFINVEVQQGGTKHTVSARGTVLDFGMKIAVGNRVEDGWYFFGTPSVSTWHSSDDTSGKKLDVSEFGALVGLGYTLAFDKDYLIDMGFPILQVGARSGSPVETVTFYPGITVDLRWHIM